MRDKIRTTVFLAWPSAPIHYPPRPFRRISGLRVCVLGSLLATAGCSASGIEPLPGDWRDAHILDILAIAVACIAICLAAWIYVLKRAVSLRTKALQAEHTRLKLLMEASTDWIWETDADHRFTYVSESFRKVTGLSPQRIMGRTRMTIVQADTGLSPWKEHMEALEAHRPVRDFVYPVEYPNGRQEWFRVSGRPQFDAAGRFAGYIGTAARITAEVERERAFAEQQAMFEYIVRAMPDAMLIFNPALQIILINDAANGLFGYDDDQLMGQDVDALLPDGTGPDSPLYYFHHPDAEEIAGPHVVKLVGRAGGEIVAELVSSPIRSPDGSLIGYLALLRDVSAREEAEAELRVAKERAEFANRAKSEFLAHMSHELRTPLNAIIGFSEILADQMFGTFAEPRYAEYARDVHDSGRHLLSIIDDLLDLSRIEAGRLTLNETRVTLPAVVAGTLRIAQERARQRHLDLSVVVPDDLPELFADDRLVRQMLINLLTNAIKFTNAGGVVEIRAGQDADGGISLAISDTGIGIAKEDLPRILEPFMRAQEAHSRKTEGTGIGLYLVKALVTAHGGTMEIESEPAVGTTVTLRFPPERTLPPVAAALSTGE